MEIHKREKPHHFHISRLDRCEDDGGGLGKKNSTEPIMASPREAKRNQGQGDNQEHVINKEETSLSQAIGKIRRLNYEDSCEAGYI